MNERIKKLFEQSFVTDDYVNVGINGVELGIRFDPEKFAELIVKECVKSLWTEECRTSDLASEEYTRGSNKIKQHFGVEE
jgi:hypothetical protein